MPFFLRSSLATAWNCFWRPGIGFVWPRWVIQPVPVYSQYMSISPDSSALRAATVPARPVWSLTDAPAFSRACSVICPSINCSVNSLDPTVNSASERFTLPEVPPPPPQPAAITARTTMRHTSRNRFTLFIRMFTPPRGRRLQKGLPLSALQTPGAQDVFGHARQPVDEQG